MIAENDEQVAKLQEVRAKLTNVKNVITMDGKTSADGWIIGWNDLVEKGKPASTRHRSPP